MTLYSEQKPFLVPTLLAAEHSVAPERSTTGEWSPYLNYDSTRKTDVSFSDYIILRKMEKQDHRGPRTCLDAVGHHDPVLWTNGIRLPVWL